jgi:NADPH:quinone reductase-like Zn-dependent oxidoreductase
VLITAAAGGVGSAAVQIAAVQIAAALGARPLGVASPDNHDYLRSLGPPAWSPDPGRP